MPWSDAVEHTTLGFLRAIARDPDDDRARIVYGDWLRERGDPRGEFIALQLRRRAAPDTKREAEPFAWREAALLAMHKREWTGALFEPLSAARRTARICRFSRGFLEVAGFFAVTAGAVEACKGDIVWSTVERLVLVPAFSCAPLFEAPGVFGALRELEGAEAAEVTTLTRTGSTPRLESLRCRTIDREGAEALERLPRLKRFALEARGPAWPATTADEYKALLALPWVRRLKRFTAGISSADPGLLLVALDAGAASAPPWLTLELHDDTHHGDITLALDGDGQRSRILIDASPAQYNPGLSAVRIAAVVARLPSRAITQVRVVGAPAYARATFWGLQNAFPGAAFHVA